MTTTTTKKLRSLLAPPDEYESQLVAQQILSSSLSDQHPIIPASLAQSLNEVLQTEQLKSVQLTQQLNVSNQAVSKLLATTRNTVGGLLQGTHALKESHEVLEDALNDHREVLVSSLSQREKQAEGTLRERLEKLNDRRKELEATRAWFGVLSRAEELGLISLKALQAINLPAAFKGYVALVRYISDIHETAPSLALTSHLVSMASSVWNSLVKTLSERLGEILESMGWPAPVAQPLDWNTNLNHEFRLAFINLLTLEKISQTNPLPSSTKSGVPAIKPLIAIQPLVAPLILRFRWHFEGSRGTNRIDKPEYPLSHVLNLLSAHDRFLRNDVQDLLNQNGLSRVDAMDEFTTLLLPSLSARLQHHIPQLLSLPPVLAHTIYQTLEFDGVLRSRNYRPRGHVGDWEGLSQVILGKREWFDRWVEGEKAFFDERYYTAIASPEAFQIISPDDYDSSEARSAVRPTNSALRVAEISDQLAERYRPLPLVYTVPFILLLQLPLLVGYSQRISASLDSFESLSFGSILPGALAEGRASTAGVVGIVRLVRAGVSARWLGEKCADWGEDPYYLSLYDYLSTATVAQEYRSLLAPILALQGGSIFDSVRNEFERLAARSEELIIRHVTREVLAEMKAYLSRRWGDIPVTSPDSPSDDDQTLTLELNTPLSLFTSLLASLATSLPPSTATTLYRRIASSISTSLYEKLIVGRVWKELSAKQLAYDFEQGFLRVGKQAGIQRSVTRGWELYSGAVRIVSLPANTAQRSRKEAEGSGGIAFSKVMQIAFDDDAAGEGEGTPFRNTMEALGVSEQVTRAQVKAVLKTRPECWR